jgi:alpha-acetolactate decarboxylase
MLETKLQVLSYQVYQNQQHAKKAKCKEQHMYNYAILVFYTLAENKIRVLDTKMLETKEHNIYENETRSNNPRNIMHRV